MRNTFGGAVSFTIFGESHGAAVGGVLDGIAAGIALDAQFVARQMQKRRAKKGGLSTSRIEADEVRFLSGVWNGITTGTPIAFVVENTNTNSADYAKTAGLARPGHADYAAHQKYAGHQDNRGGGHFSGRVTAAVVAAGAICQSILAQKNVFVATHIQSIADMADTALDTTNAEALSLQLARLDANNGFPVLDKNAGEAMQAIIWAAGQQGDSVGGVLETAATGLTAGVGEPFFDSVESTLSHLLFSIPAVKGVEFGAGFGFAQMQGSTANDAFCIKNGAVATKTNHNGGVNGGILNGMPLVVRSCVKPTPSIFKPQQTVDLQTMTEAEITIKGRHDPCILHRAAIVQTAMISLGLLDLYTQRFGTIWQAEQ